MSREQFADPFTSACRRCEDLDRVRDKKYPPETRVSSPAELRELYPEYHDETDQPIGIPFEEEPVAEPV